MSVAEVIVWADVETTGLRPGRPDQLLEIAAIVTDLELNALGDSFHRVVYQDTQEVYELADEYVQNMHTETGLWDRLGEGDSLEDVDDAFIRFIKTHAPDARQARLAGNSVRLDANFIDEFLPQSSRHLHYRLLDVSSLAFEAYTVRDFEPFHKTFTHSAMSDIRESIEELKYIRRVLGY